MNRELIINVNPTEVSIALCEDKVLVELNKEQCQTGFAVGDIYLGRVRKIMPGLNAAFVNIGHEKDAFIHYLDLGANFESLRRVVDSRDANKRPVKVESMKLEPALPKEGRIGDYIKVGDTIMVQIAKEAISTKGPRLTADISLAGRNVVLVPFSNKVYVSTKIRSNTAKKRLRKVAQDVLPQNFGVIVRTAAADAEDIDIMQDILSLVERWNKAVGAMRKSEAPARLISEMSRVNTIIRDSLNDTFSQILVDDETMYNEIKSYIHAIKPEMERMVKLYKGKVPIFDQYDVAKQIKSLFAKYVSLRRGAYLIIE
ncbi:MAG: ribonuclease E/G, partial [Alistipes sp.]|nr:ribonuclease E/G [Alistipes sp.]